MNFPPRFFNISYLLFTVIFLLTSCAKDEDLFAEIIQQNMDEELIEQVPDSSNQNSQPENSSPTTPNTGNPSTTGSPGLKAFPTAEGFGKYAVGGRGGDIYKVTNLNDSGTGSLREACEANGPRTILFDVSGLIALRSPINIRNSNITIAGQSAPADGIALSLEGLDQPAIEVNASDVIIRYLRIRHSTSYVGASSGADGIYIASGQNIIIDHCSLSWASDENLAIAEYSDADVENITVQNSIIAAGFTGSSKGGLMTGDLDKITFYRNYFGHNNIRNVKISSDWGYPNGDRVFEFINNVVYDYKNAFQTSNNQGSGRYLTNVIGNWFDQPNGATSARRAVAIYDNYEWTQAGNQSGEVGVFVSDNYDQFRTSSNQDEWEITQGLDGVANKDVLGDRSRQSQNPYNTQIVMDNIGIVSASELWNSIKTEVGASIPNRDSFDKVLISNYDNGIGPDYAYVTHTMPNYNSGTAYTDSDEDGIPDVVEDSLGTNPNQFDSNEDINSDGYTNLEEYLNSIRPF